MTTSPPFVEALHDFARPGQGGHGRPHVILVVGTSEPGARAMQDAVWLGRHLRAVMLVVSAVEYRPPPDELVAARVELIRGVVSSTAEHLVDQGVDAAGTVLVARDGLGAGGRRRFLGPARSRSGGGHGAAPHPALGFRRVGHGAPPDARRTAARAGHPRSPAGPGGAVPVLARTAESLNRRRARARTLTSC